MRWPRCRTGLNCHEGENASLVRIKEPGTLDGVIKNVVKLFERFTQLDADAPMRRIKQMPRKPLHHKTRIMRCPGRKYPGNIEARTSFPNFYIYSMAGGQRCSLSNTNMKRHKMHCFRFCAILSGLLSPPSSTNGSSSGGAGTDQKMHF